MALKDIACLKVFGSCTASTRLPPQYGCEGRANLRRLPRARSDKAPSVNPRDPFIATIVLRAAGPALKDPMAAPRPDIFPEKVQARNGRHVVAEGFIIPLDVTPSGASMFVLNPYVDVCIFGIPPRLNDWVLVTMPPGQRVQHSSSPPVYCYIVVSVERTNR